MDITKEHAMTDLQSLRIECGVADGKLRAAAGSILLFKDQEPDWVPEEYWDMLRSSYDEARAAHAAYIDALCPDTEETSK